jgi:hypothetical protein
VDREGTGRNAIAGSIKPCRDDAKVLQQAPYSLASAPFEHFHSKHNVQQEGYRRRHRTLRWVRQYPPMHARGSTNLTPFQSRYRSGGAQQRSSYPPVLLHLVSQDAALFADYMLTSFFS